MSNQYKELADAIRKGAKMRPQCQGTYFRNGCSCAVAAACEGAGLVNYELYTRHGLTFCGRALLTETFGISDDIFDEIVVRNDTKKQSREEIADWVESLGEKAVAE